MGDEHDSWLSAIGINIGGVSPSAGAPAIGATPAPQLHFQLTADELAKCNAYLAAHFDALLKAGAPPAMEESYQPGLDGKSADIFDVVHALMPLTLAGSMSKDGKDPMYKDTWSQLYEMVNSRYQQLVLAKASGALQAATTKGVDKTNAASSEAEEWVKKYLSDHGLGPDIAGDGSGSTVMLDNKSRPLATVIDMIVAAGQKADLPSGDAARSSITSELVARLVTARLVQATRPAVPGRKGSAKDGSLPNLSMNLQYTFTPETDHTTASGQQSKDQPAHALSGTLNLAFHADDKSGWEVSATGQVTWFADDDKGHIQTQSGLAGAQVAWVWTFLGGALQAGPLFQALVGASRAKQVKTDKMEWKPTGQVGVGGQVQYAIPGFDGHVQVGVQAGMSGTGAGGAEGTVDQAAAFTFTYKF
jgi:hypothetical protein